MQFPWCNRLAIVVCWIGFTPLLVTGQDATEQAVKQQTAKKLKRIMLAVHNYDGAKGSLPAAYTSKDGKPLLSWRVAILPYLGQRAFYDEFHLEEPWDSDHNKALIAKMPDVYLGPTSKHKDGRTVYLTPRGEQTVFPGDRSVTIEEITDGLSNTIAILEVDEDCAVPWTKPDDWMFDPNDPSGGLWTEKCRLKALLERGGDTRLMARTDGQLTRGFCAVFCDGAVRFISDKSSDANVKHAFIRNDGENNRFNFQLIRSDSEKLRAN